MRTPSQILRFIVTKSEKVLVDGVRCTGGDNKFERRQKAAAHGALLSHGAAERRLLRKTHAIEVSDRFKLPIPV